MLKPEVNYTYFLKDASAFYHEGMECLHIISDDGELTLENLSLKTLRGAIKRRTK